MAEDRIEELGTALGRAWLSQQATELPTPELAPRTAEESYDIQDVMTRVIGEDVVGWKVGGTFAGPIAGRVFSSRLISSPGRLDVGRYVNPFLECELALRLTQDLPAVPEGYTADRLRNLVSLHLTIEMTTSRFINGPQSPTNETEWRLVVADNTAASGIIEGPEVADWRRLDLRAVAAVLSFDGVEIVRSNPPEERRDPLETLAWLTTHLGQRGITMAAGQIVSTGSITQPQQLPSGAHAVVDYGDLGLIEAHGPE